MWSVPCISLSFAIPPERIAGFPSLYDFTQRRLLPAVRTCAAHTDRENQLSMRAHRFVSLLRARIETRIENQNARLLKSMERSSDLQLRLQQLVEGFSIIALSYYCLGLLDHLLEGLDLFGGEAPARRILAFLTPFVIIGMWWMIYHFKRRALGRHHDKIPGG